MEEEKEALLMKVGQLRVEVDWLKKNLESSKSACERVLMVEFELKSITLSRQCELFSINRTRIYYEPVQGPGGVYKQLLIKHIDQIHTEHPYYGKGD